MIKTAKILAKKLLYKGFNQVCCYDLEISSMRQKKTRQILLHREVIHCSDAVVVLIYLPLLDAFLLCQEFRVGIFFNQDNDDSYIYECVAGMIDRKDTPLNIAITEVYEEAGLHIDNLQLIAMAYASPGRMTEKVYLYYTEVNEIPETGFFGLESEGEEIQTKIVSRFQVYQMLDQMKIIDSMTLIALNWFRANKS